MYLREAMILIFSSMTLIFTLVGCGLKPLTDAGDTSETEESSNEEITTKKVTSAEGGTLSVNSGDIAGTELVVPAGALAIDTNITVEAGSSLVTDTLTDDLELGEENSVESAGPSVVVEPDQLVDATQPLSLAITLDPSFALQNQNLAVLYIVKKASENGQAYLGLITDVTKESGKLKFSTIHFGAFQAVVLAKAVTGVTEKKTSQTISAKRNATEAEGLWVMPCYAVSKTDQADANVQSVRERLNFAGNTFLYRREIFSGADCERVNRQKITTIKASFKVGAEYSVVPGSKELDVTYNEMMFIPPTAAVASNWNSIEYCGVSDWTSGEGKPYNDECRFDGNSGAALQPGDDMGGGFQDGGDDFPPDGSDVGFDGGGADEGLGPDGPGGMPGPDGPGGDPGPGAPDSGGGQDDQEDQGCDNDEPPEIGTTIYTVYKIKGDALTLGLELDDETCEEWADTPDNRPVKLESEGFQRQQL